MNSLLEFLNSKFGLLLSGAIISGVCVQYLSAAWQRRNWIFQQTYTAEQALFEKELDQKYKLLEEINAAAAAILAHSRFVIAAHVKGVPEAQQNELVVSYNQAVLKWDADFGLYSIRLRTLFHKGEPIKRLEAIKRVRDESDVEIFQLTAGTERSPERALSQLEEITTLTVELSRHLIAEIQSMKDRVGAKRVRG
jgi:hypothetical protein